MSKIIKLNVLIITMLVLYSGFITAGGQQEKVAEYAGEEGRITVYLSGPAAMLDKLEQVFEKENGDVLDFVHMGCGPLRQRVWTEMESGSINADVFWGADPLIFIALEERDVLEKYVPTGSDKLKPEFQTSGSYTFVNERYGVVIYNKDVVGVKPSAFADLLEPQFSGTVCHADPSQSSTALALISGLWNLNSIPGDYHKQLAANGLFLTKKNSDVPSKIQEGEFSAGIAPHDAVLRLQKKAKKDGYPTPLAIAWPLEGAAAIQRPIAISRNDARPEVNSKIAHMFVDFMISKPAQKITSQFGFVSVRSDMPATEGVPENLEIRSVDWIQLSGQQNEINEEFKKYFK